MRHSGIDMNEDFSDFFGDIPAKKSEYSDKELNEQEEKPVKDDDFFSIDDVYDYHVKKQDFYFVPKKYKKTEVNYIHVEPDSHFFTNIEQILQNISLKCQIMDKEKYLEYLITGLKNTLKNGYDIQKVDDDSQFEEDFE